VGQISTDGLYFASGRLDVPGAMFTASHNPPEYNGLKLCRERAAPIGADSGLVEIRKLAEDFDVDRRRQSVGEPLDIMDDFTTSGAPPGRDIEHMDMLRDYADHVRSFVDIERLSPLRIAIDAGNGMAGATVPVVFEPLPFEIVPLYFELDGTFPNHLANPIEEQNLVDLQRTVRDNRCHVGIAFDGDADRMFLVDEAGEPISGSLTTALVADRILKKHPGEKIIYNLICSWTVPEVIIENGGEPIRTRVGHSFIKEVMARTGAIFGGEHSGHYYFRDNFRADSGMVAALLVLEAMSEAQVPLSETLRPFRRYAASSEINSVVADQPGTLEALARRYADGKQDTTDGLTVEYEDWWFNCRPSNTEPLLRLNLEARTRELMEAKREEVLALIRGAA
jgi:phosphomannomutase